MDEDQPVASSDEAPIVQPRRGRRLRLGLLLLLLLALCATFGGWHVYAGYLAPYIETAGPAVEGKPVVIRGGYADFLGFDSETVAVDVSRVNSDGQSILLESATGRAKRRGLWNYDFEIELKQITEGGEYEIEVRPMTRAVHTRRQHVPADSIWGRINVSQAK